MRLTKAASQPPSGARKFGIQDNIKVRVPKMGDRLDQPPGAQRHYPNTQGIEQRPNLFQIIAVAKTKAHGPQDIAAEAGKGRPRLRRRLRRHPSRQLTHQLIEGLACAPVFFLLIGRELQRTMGMERFSACAGRQVILDQLRRAEAPTSSALG